MALFAGTSGLKELALFAGAGGGLLGTSLLGTSLLGWQPVGAVEKAPYRREVLLRRQRDGVLPVFPIWDDVRTFDGRPWRGKVDIVTAGFPCQPFSVAGKRRGADDERNLWPETIRIICEVGPRFCLLENVPGLVSNGYLRNVLGGLADAGFDAEWDIVSAADVGAPHLRKRLWVLAYTEHGRIPQRRRVENAREDGGERRGICGDESPSVVSETGEIPNTIIDRPERQQQAGATAGPIDRSGDGSDPGWWSTESEMVRVADGVAHRSQRLAAIGDGQIPAVVAAAWRLLTCSCH